MAIEELLARHEAGGRAAVSRGGGLPAVPALHTVLLTCMDCRIDAYAAFGLAPGEVHVLRNAGGVVTDDVVRSLTISQRKLRTREVLLVRHAGCGLTSFTEEEFAEELAADTGMQPPWRTYAFGDPVVGVRRDMALLRRDPFLLPGTPVRGFVLDLRDGHLQEVDGDGRADALA